MSEAASGTRENLVGIILSLFLYGIFVDILFNCLPIIRCKIASRTINIPQFLTFCSIAALTTLRAIIDIIRVMNVFTFGPEKDYFAFPPPWKGSTIIITSLWVVEVVVADSFMIYRVWVVWGRRFIPIILPLALLFGGTGGGIYLIVTMSTYKGPDDVIFSPTWNLPGLLFAIFTVLLTVICTGMIGDRIWSIKRSLSSNRSGVLGPDPVRKLLAIIVESALLYTILWVILIILDARKSPVAYAIHPLIPPMIGIVFGSIMVRSCQGLSWEAEISEQASGCGPGNRCSIGRPEQRRTTRGDVENQILSGVQIHLHQVVTTHVSGEDRSTRDEEDVKP